MANIVEILIKANDQATTPLGKINTAFKSMTGISLTAAGGIALAGAALKATIDFTKKAVSETVSYNTSIIDQARLIGINVEEMSRLVQAAGDVFISEEQLKTALQAATRQGIDVSIDGLKKLSAEYLALDPKAERGAYLMKTFGRAGADMGKLMELGADGIQEATDAISENLIVTEDSAKKTIEYQQAVDALNGSWQGVKYSAGNLVIPYLTKVGMLLSDLTSNTITAREAWRNYFQGTIWESNQSKQLREDAHVLEMFNYMMGKGEEKIISLNDNGYKIWIDSMGICHRDLVTAIDDQDEYNKTITQTNKTMLGMAGSFTSIQKTFEEGMKGLNEEVVESQKNLDYWTAVVARAPAQVKDLTDKVTAMEAAGDANSKAYKDAKDKLEEWTNVVEHGPGYLTTLNGKLDKNKQKIDDLKAAYERETNQVILGYLQQQAMADGILTNDEMNWLLEKGVAWGIYSKDAIEKMRAVQAEWENWTPEDKGVIFTVTTKVIGNGTVVNKGNGVTMETKGSGGPVMGNTPYLVGERGPEVIVPNGSGTVVSNKNMGGGISAGEMRVLLKKNATDTADALAIKLAQMGLL